VALTSKQRAFISYYLTCWNASESARLAGYSEHTAGQIGFNLLKKVEIMEAIKQRLAAMQMSADEILVRLTEQARGSMADFIDPETAKVNLQKAEQAGRLGLLKSFSRTDGKESDTVKIELYDAQNALALLGKAHKLFVDRSEIGMEIRNYVVDIGKDQDASVNPATSGDGGAA
jgi:phage terminase small subunit